MNALEKLRELKPNEFLSADQVFDALSFAGSLINCNGRESKEALEVAIRLLATKQKGQIPPGCAEVVDYLAEECGLYQYINKESFNLITQSVVEAHSVRLNKKCYLHSMQMQALLMLLNGDNLILSAPTSFGKSILVDAYISLKKPHTVVIILPTIALIDETRRRLKETFQDRYKLVTSATGFYSAELPTIFILTQERFILREDVQVVDFLFVDEFYKLDPDRRDGRFETLNIALYRALKIAKQSFMAGPNISHIDVGGVWSKRFTFLHTDYNTVSVNVIDRSSSEDRLKVFLTDLKSVGTDSSLIFTSSPGSAQALLDVAVRNGVGSESKIRGYLSDWLASNYHSGWPLAAGVRRGVAIHHGRLPRSLGQLFISLFDKGVITVLFCTSTLIEGVNTSASNVFVYDKKINRVDFDFFSFANIRGRVGRMMRHFVGNAYLYHEPPKEIETNVTIPVLLDPGASTDYILMNVDYDSLSKEGKRRQEQLPDQTGLAEDVLKKHGGLGVNVLILLREKVQEALLKNPASLMWSGKPSNSQRRVLAELVVFAAKQKNEGFGRISFRQVSWAWSQLSYYKKMPDFLHWFTGKLGRLEENDSSIDRAFQFLQACEFKFPQKVMAIESIVKSISPGAQLDYSFYAAALESWFRPAWMKQLDEIGVPIPLSERVSNYLNSPASSDDAILQLSKLNLKDFPGLDVIDKYLLKAAIASAKGSGVQLSLG